MKATILFQNENFLPTNFYHFFTSVGFIVAFRLPILYTKLKFSTIKMSKNLYGKIKNRFISQQVFDNFFNERKQIQKERPFILRRNSIC